jgi:hypothetical protein
VRRLWLFLIFIAFALFLVVSALLARAFTVDGAERSAVTELVRAQARGDRSGMASRITGCNARAACQTRVAQNADALKLPGNVAILQLTPSTGFSLGGSVGSARVAWKVPSSRPIVQCVRVRRAGDVLQGIRVQLLAITPRLRSDSTCPRSF